MLYSSASTEHSLAPSVGAEWLITRTRGGLYLSFDQAFLTTTGQFLDREPDSTFYRNVALKNLRRFPIAAMVFPMQTARYHPYVGFGMGLNQIGSATFAGSFATPARYQVALDSVQSKKTSFSPTFVGGHAGAHDAVLRVRAGGRVARRSRASSSPRRTTAVRSTSALEGGVRYNFGSSIDRVR